MPVANHKPTKQTTISLPRSNEIRFKLPETKSSYTTPRITSSNRSATSQIPKNASIYPTLITGSSTPYYSNYHQYRQDARYLYVVNALGNSHQTPLIQTSNNNLNPLPRPHPHYGHFLAYLRRQSLARLRRKREQKELDDAQSVDTAITLNSSKTTSHSFHSMSNFSIGTLTSDVASMPAISTTSKQKSRSITPHRQLERPSSSSLMPTKYRLNLNQPLPPRQTTPLRIEKEKISDNHSSILPSKTVSATPTNSIADETNASSSSSSNKTPYEVKLSGDLLSYCYISDSGVTYQGQLLSSLV